MNTQFSEQLKLVYEMLDYLPISMLNQIDLDEYIKIRKLQMADGMLKGVQDNMKEKKRANLRLIK